MSEYSQMNITNDEKFTFGYVDESNKYKNIYEYTSTKIIALMTYTLVETVGNALWWGIIHYELFGGDPMKRSITNKGISLHFKHLLNLHFDNLVFSIQTSKRHIFPFFSQWTQYLLLSHSLIFTRDYLCGYHHRGNFKGF